MKKLMIKKAVILFKKAVILFNKIGDFILSFSLLVTGLYFKLKIHLHTIYLKKASFFIWLWRKNTKFMVTRKLLVNLDSLPSDIIFQYRLFPIWHSAMIVPYKKSAGFLKYQSWRGMENSFDLLLTITFCLFLQDFFSICDTIYSNGLDPASSAKDLSTEGTSHTQFMKETPLDKPYLTPPVSDTQEHAPLDKKGRIVIIVVVALIFHTILRDGFG